MAPLLTIDASVFVASVRPREPGHAACRALWGILRGADVPLIEPALLPIEVAAALGRTGGTRDSVAEFVDAILALPGLTLVPLAEGLARRAAALAAERRLRAADAVYVAVAQQYGARLVTLDGEQLARSPSDVRACRPEAAARRLTGEPSGPFTKA
jgi:predicted nucleic acid-binding protein